MKRIQTDVWETRVESPFPGLNTHAYLLTRDGGNVLFYSTSHVDELDRMAELGGRKRRGRFHHLPELSQTCGQHRNVDRKAGSPRFGKYRFQSS